MTGQETQPTKGDADLVMASLSAVERAPKT
jgi:hypothetical protein